jgi:hypothetical protein
MAMCINATKTTGHLNVIDDELSSAENMGKPFKSTPTVGETWPMCCP